MERLALPAIQTQPIPRYILCNGKTKLVIGFRGVIKQGPASRSPDLFPSRIRVFEARTAVDEGLGDGGLDCGVGVAGEEGGNAVAGVPAVQVREVAVCIVGDVVAVGIGEFPFFDCAKGGDVEACIEGFESSGEGG